MTDSFADRLRAAHLATAGDLPDGADLCVQLRATLERDGFACDEVFADEDGWCFFVSADACPVCVTLYRANGVQSGSWQVVVAYEGGLSSIWSEENARQGAVLAARIRTLLTEHLRRLDGGADSQPNALR